MKIPQLAEQIELGTIYTFRKPNDNLAVTGRVEGIDRKSTTGNLALTHVRIDGLGWLTLSEWTIKGEK